MKISIDEGRCIAAGNCVMEAMDLFDQREEDGIVVVLDDSPEGTELQAAARRAAAVCPSHVIAIVE
jgi:ferredoxin